MSAVGRDVAKIGLIITDIRDIIRERFFAIDANSQPNIFSVKFVVVFDFG